MAKTKEWQTYLQMKSGKNMVLFNLQNINFAGKEKFIKYVKNTMEATPKTAYEASIPVLISAQIGDQELYQKSLNIILGLIDNGEDNSFKAWLYGRILIAAKNINDTETVTLALNKLHPILEKSKNDNCKAWALGYLGSLNETEYDKCHGELISLISKLTNEFEALAEKTKDDWSNILWSLVMLIQASTHDNNKDTYNFALTEIKRLTDTNSVPNAIVKGLQRTDTFNEFPSWALSIIRLASVKIGDKLTYDEIDLTYRNSLQEALDLNYMGEYYLAELNNILAIENQKLQEPSVFIK